MLVKKKLFCILWKDEDIPLYKLKKISLYQKELYLDINLDIYALFLAINSVYNVRLVFSHLLLIHCCQIHYYFVSIWLVVCTLSLSQFYAIFINVHKLVTYYLCLPFPRSLLLLFFLKGAYLPLFGCPHATPSQALVVETSCWAEGGICGVGGLLGSDFCPQQNLAQPHTVL